MDPIPQIAWSLSDAERAEVLGYLRSLYTGVFSESAFTGHLENHVGFAFANYTIAVMIPNVPKGARIVDFGSGFGSCVLAARNAGFDAVGIELASFEVEFARRRLASVRPQDRPDRIYLLGDAISAGLPAASGDVLTLWNVLEHIENLAGVLGAARELLKSGGVLYAICPNYFAWRLEAHYHVPWKPNPLLPRRKAVAYLRSLQKDPAYFETAIFRRTNWEVLGALRALGFELRDISSLHSMSSGVRNLLRHPWRFLDFYNPFRHSVVLAATKR